MLLHDICECSVRGTGKVLIPSLPQLGSAHSWCWPFVKYAIRHGKPTHTVCSAWHIKPGEEQSGSVAKGPWMCSRTVLSTFLTVSYHWLHSYSGNWRHICFVNNLEISDTAISFFEGHWELQYFWRGAPGLVLWLELPWKGDSLGTLPYYPLRGCCHSEGPTLSFHVLKRQFHCLRMSIPCAWMLSVKRGLWGIFSCWPHSLPGLLIWKSPSAAHADPRVHRALLTPPCYPVCSVCVCISLQCRDYEIHMASPACVYQPCLCVPAPEPDPWL